MKNKRLSREYGIRFDDEECINISEAKKILDERNRKIAELKKLQKEIGEWTVI